MSIDGDSYHLLSLEFPYASGTSAVFDCVSYHQIVNRIRPGSRTEGNKHRLWYVFVVFLPSIQRYGLERPSVRRNQFHRFFLR